jgi:hypothetical protein
VRAYSSAPTRFLWERPDSAEEYTDLLLLVERGRDRKWRWEASISPRVAGNGAHLLANGTAPSLDRAKVDCEASATRLILDQEQRYGPLLTPLSPVVFKGQNDSQMGVESD